MQVSLIVAMSQTNAIGKGGQLLWHLPNDLKYFKEITMGKPIVMGRTTYESIGKPLPGRTNIILSNNPDYVAPGCVILHNKEAVFDYCQKEPEIMVIGGAQIYQLFLAEATTLYLTKVYANLSGDTFFPEIDMKQWQEVTRDDFQKDGTHLFSYSFIKYVRREIY